MAMERRRKSLLNTIVPQVILPRPPTRPRDRPNTAASHNQDSQDPCEACSLAPSKPPPRSVLASEGNRGFDKPNGIPSQHMNLASTREWTFAELLKKGKRFRPVPRVLHSSRDLDKQLQHYENSGVPLVVDGWHHSSRWPNHLFKIDHCRQYFRESNKEISVRNVHTRTDRLMKFDDFLERSGNMPTFTEAGETERWYGKDVECPQKWEEWLRKERVLPDRLIPEGSDDYFGFRPKQHGRPDIETLMCYFGVADTYTPCHKDLCASSGQNLMCYTEREGSSFWFMTKGSDSVKVTEYFHTLRQELDHETHVITVEELAAAPFDVFIVEQKLGDLVLVPPRSCHQVVNFGGMTIKMAWSRMSLAGLSMALYHELPLYRRVCRPETYQIKSTIFYTLYHYTEQLKARTPQVSQKRRRLPDVTQNRSALVKHLIITLRLYDRILLEEFGPSFNSKVLRRAGTRSCGTETLPENLASGQTEGFCTCDFCGADIFQSYFQCVDGVDKPDRDGAEGDGFIVCPGCYVEGRTCSCQDMKPMQRQDFTVLFDARWEALDALRKSGSSVEEFKGSNSREEQKRHFSRQSDRSVFQVAILLYHARQQQRQDRKFCGTEGNHSVPAMWALNCKKCHRSKCFPHLLKNHRMHSIQALLLQEQDKTHEVFHQCHKERLPEYEQGKEKLLKAQSDGTPCPDFNLHMVYNSLTFGVCEPINPGCASLGWYDSHAPSMNSDELSESQHIEASQLRGGSTQGDLGNDLMTDASSSLPSTGSSQRTENRAYVEVVLRGPRHTSSQGHAPGPISGLRSSPSNRDNPSSLNVMTASQLPTPQLDKDAVARKALYQSKRRSTPQTFDTASLFDEGSSLSSCSSDSENLGPSILAARDGRPLLKRRRLMDNNQNSSSTSGPPKPQPRDLRKGIERNGTGPSRIGLERSSVIRPSTSYFPKRPAPVRDNSDDGSATVVGVEPSRKRFRREKIPEFKSRPTDNPSEVRADLSATLSDALNSVYDTKKASSSQTKIAAQSGKTIAGPTPRMIVLVKPGNISIPPQPQPQPNNGVTGESAPPAQTSLQSSTLSPRISPSVQAALKAADAVTGHRATSSSQGIPSTSKPLLLAPGQLDNVVDMAVERAFKQLKDSLAPPPLSSNELVGSFMAALAANRLLNNGQMPFPAADPYAGTRPMFEGIQAHYGCHQPTPPIKNFQQRQNTGYQYQRNTTWPREHRSQRDSMDRPNADWSNQGSFIPQSTRGSYQGRHRNYPPTYNCTSGDSRAQRPFVQPPSRQDHSLTNDHADDTPFVHHHNHDMGGPNTNSSGRPWSNNHERYMTQFRDQAQTQDSFQEMPPRYRPRTSFGRESHRPGWHAHNNSSSHHPQFSPRRDPRPPYHNDSPPQTNLQSPMKEPEERTRAARCNLEGSPKQSSESGDVGHPDAARQRHGSKDRVEAQDERAREERYPPSGSTSQNSGPNLGQDTQSSINVASATCNEQQPGCDANLKGPQASEDRSTGSERAAPRKPTERNDPALPHKDSRTTVVSQDASARALAPVQGERPGAELSKSPEEDQYWEDEYEKDLGVPPRQNVSKSTAPIEVNNPWA